MAAQQIISHARVYFQKFMTNCNGVEIGARPKNKICTEYVADGIQSVRMITWLETI